MLWRVNGCLFCACGASGEAYDKVARLLGLDPKPSGGAALEAFAREGNPAAFPCASPLMLECGQL